MPWNPLLIKIECRRTYVYRLLSILLLIFFAYHRNNTTKSIQKSIWTTANASQRRDEIKHIDEVVTNHLHIDSNAYSQLMAAHIQQTIKKTGHHLDLYHLFTPEHSWVISCVRVFLFIVCCFVYVSTNFHQYWCFWWLLIDKLMDRMCDLCKWELTDYIKMYNSSVVLCTIEIEAEAKVNF